jgi:hypothetical protein
LDIRHRLEHEAMPRRGLLQSSEVAGAARAEAKIAADEQPAHPEAAHQHVFHEALGGQGGETRVEARDVHVLDAGLRQKLQLVAQPREARRCSLGGEKFAGMRFESQYAGSELGFACPGNHAIDERAMAAVHAVEVADRQRTPAPGALQRAVRDDHGRG